MADNTIYQAGLYCRLSKDDDQDGESISIGTQRSILSDFCAKHGYMIHDVYIDDGYSGMNFNRPDFMRLMEDVENGAINMVITKDLSRLGRDYIMTGYYSEVFFPAKGIRYIAVADDFDSAKGGNDIAPFRNILNDMYARDISKKVRNAKRQRARQGLFIGGQAPYGYCKNPDNRNTLIIDPEAAEAVKTIFTLAINGYGDVAIASELEARKVCTPSVYKYRHGDKRFSRYSAVRDSANYAWCSATVGRILTNPVYTGVLVSLKTETTNCKTKQRAPVRKEQQIVTEYAHEAIIPLEQFNAVQQIRAAHCNPTDKRRDNLFRGKLFCDCCGHPLTISKKQLKERTTDIYFCMYHFQHPEVCPKTHRIYHEMLYPYVLQQIRAFANSMKRRKVNIPIKEYASAEELTPQMLNDVIERIEIGHVKHKSKPGNVIQIYWKL